MSELKYKNLNEISVGDIIVCDPVPSKYGMYLQHEVTEVKTTKSGRVNFRVKSHYKSNDGTTTVSEHWYYNAPKETLTTGCMRYFKIKN